MSDLKKKGLIRTKNKKRDKFVQQQSLKSQLLHLLSLFMPKPSNQNTNIPQQHKLQLGQIQLRKKKSMCTD